jgi:tetratricopeptide (TPR) repeat protein
MAQNKKVQEEQPEVQVSSFEKFIKKYQKILTWGIIGILVIVFGILAINRWVVKPAQEEARGQMFPAEQLFAAGNFEQALNGDGNILGFAQVADQYGAKAGKSLWLYAGISAYNTGDYEAAVSYLKKYNGKDKLLKGRALCCLGDAYVNLDQKDKALGCYKKAAALEENIYRAAYLLKAGMLCEEMGNDAQALKYYKEIETRYPQTMEAYEIQKFISRIENK